MIANHPTDLQIFERNMVVNGYKAIYQLVEVILAAVGDVGVKALQRQNGLAPVGAARLAPRNLALDHPQFLLFFPVPAGFSTTSFSLVASRWRSPTSMPTSRPVGSSGFSCTSQAKQAYHLPACRQMRTVLITPSSGRCQRTLKRPIPVRRSLLPSSLNPFPYSFSPKLSKRFLPLKRGYPAFSPAFTRRKNAWNALSTSAATTCKMWLCSRPAKGFSWRYVLTFASWSYLLTLRCSFSQAVLRSSRQRLYHRRQVSTVCSSSRICGLEG